MKCLRILLVTVLDLVEGVFALSILVMLKLQVLFRVEDVLLPTAQPVISILMDLVFIGVSELRFLSPSQFVLQLFLTFELLQLFTIAFVEDLIFALPVFDLSR